MNAYPIAHLASLPHSLSHITPNNALRDARDLASFLRDLEYLMEENESFPKDASFARGREKVFDLLLDKLDIASGIYLFPMGSMESSEVLAERGDD